MKEKLKNLKKKIKIELEQVPNLQLLKNIEKKYLGRKEGELNQILKKLKNLSEKERREIGQLANEMKEDLLKLVNRKQNELETKGIKKELDKEWTDISMPTESKETGHVHPISLVQYELEDIFRSLNFKILDGPELESDYYNFQAVNIPPDHPAREMQDTFYIKNDKARFLLRTHTSSEQVRALQKYGAPLRAVIPGRVFRYEAVDASHDNTFDQLEGLVVDKDISISNLIATMKTLLRGIFKKK